ncbi:putative proteasome endopeptidase complex [Helianthus annuus]|nr:putative proteasome endopeptidase complex [Helianthus annuus]
MKVEKVPDFTYDMLGGVHKQIKEIKEGVLLYGPPGTGKTLLAIADAHDTDCIFIRDSGSELVQKYIGEGSRMVRELFVMARMESGSGNGDSEVQRTMLKLLNQLDGFEASKKIKVWMATNRINILDQALLRPRRIDWKIEFPNPSEDLIIRDLITFENNVYECPLSTNLSGHLKLVPRVHHELASPIAG